MLKQMKMNKKGQFEPARKTIYWAIAGFVIAIVALAFAMVLLSFKTKLVEVSPQLQAETISLRFANIPECFAYQDPITKRVYPGVIDPDKFTQQQMDESCYAPEKEKGYKDFNFKLHLVNLDKTIKTNNYYNADIFNLRKAVFVKEGDILREDIMVIAVQPDIPYRPSYVE
jgi:hypothetical protein